MKVRKILASLLLLFATGCGDKPGASPPPVSPPIAATPKAPAFSYSEILRWEIPPAPDGQLHGLQGIAIGAKGEVFVADVEGKRVVVCSEDGKILRTITGHLQMPFAVLHNGRDRIYVTDYGADQVQVYTPEGKFLFRWGREGTGPGQFQSPVGIAQDQERNLYVVEFYGHRVQKFTEDGKFLLTWGEEADWNRPNDPPEKMLYPAGIDVGPDGNVYVADSGRDKIKVFTSTGTFVRQFGGKGTKPGKFSAMSGISFDKAGRLYEADSSAHRVQMFSKEGEFLAYWNVPDVQEEKIWSPTKIFAYQDKFLFVSDVAKNKIYKLQIEEGQKR